MATEFALKKLPVRVCAIAPGVYESEMTTDKVLPQHVDKIGLGVVPVPLQRAGTYVFQRNSIRVTLTQVSQSSRGCRNSHLPCVPCRMLHEWPGDRD